MSRLNLTFRVIRPSSSVLLFLLIGLSSPAAPPAQHAEDDRLPPGQRTVQNFPLLHIGEIPDLDHENWRLRVHGLVEGALDLNWNRFLSFDTVGSVSDFHCVTGWSRLGNRWTGVRIRDVLEAAGLMADTRFVMFRSGDGYSTSLAIGECTGDDDILAFRLEGSLLDKDRGGPVRVVIPEKYAYKSALWVLEMEVTKDQELGYFEARGYSNSADPWKEERYSEKDEKGE